MANRMDLQRVLKTVCSNVYFQPPESLKLTYPCIIYSRSDADHDYADNQMYNHRLAYQIIIVDKDPDSALIETLFTKLPMTKFDRHYISDNLNHDVFTIYY